MNQRLKAVYQNGTFILRERFDMPEGSEVELTVQSPFVFLPDVVDPEERSRILAQLVQRMRQNPIPAGAPGLTREELHGRS